MADAEPPARGVVVSARDGLCLTARDGLPDAIACLRPRYPAGSWPRHANYGELAGFWLAVHDSLRQAGAGLRASTRRFREGHWCGVDFQRHFTPQLRDYLRHLQGHHQIEDAHYFPRFRRLDSRLVPGFELLERDHEVIHRHVLAAVDRARLMLAALEGPPDHARHAADRYAETADTLLSLLDRHLADEEDLVIPAMLEYGEASLQ